MARFEEGRSISCPPLFEGEAYSQWSNVMKYFILAQEFELWDIIEKGYIEAPKKKKKQMSENNTKAKLNARTMHILLCGLNEEVSKKVSTCKRAKEMWEKLERLYGKEEKKDGHHVLASSHHQRWMVLWLSMSPRHLLTLVIQIRIHLKS
ncbi:hypothetical protein GQ457_03G023930 [Hibiscus cannabinus]